jgi:putative alpha-1,2-mannosidase
MSAWYIFSSLGFYPVCPGSDEYALGAPSFSKITIRLTEPHPDKTITIIAHNLSKTNIYVKQIKLDGRVLDKPFIKHSELIKAEMLEFEMTDAPV